MFARSPVSQSETTCDHCSAQMTQHLKNRSSLERRHVHQQICDALARPTRGSVSRTPNSGPPTTLSQRTGCQRNGHSPAPRRREASTSRFHRAQVVSLAHELRSCVLHRTVRRSSCGLEITQNGLLSSRFLHSCDTVP